MTDRKKLREAAMKASPGGWGVEDRCVKSPGRVVARLDWDNRDHIDDANAEFIALASPQTILSLLDDLDRKTVGEVVSGHQWTESTLGHGTRMCERCGCTDAELAALGELDKCSSALAPSPAIGRDDEESVRGEDWENAAHDLLWETGRRDEFEALREKADENARERSQP